MQVWMVAILGSELGDSTVLVERLGAHAFEVAACFVVVFAWLQLLARSGTEQKAPHVSDQPRKQPAASASVAESVAEHAAPCEDADGEQSAMTSWMNFDWSLLFCCYGRGDEAPNKQAGSGRRVVRPDTVAGSPACGYSVEEILQSGVPEQDAPGVAQLAACLDLRGSAAASPLADPATLFRFLSAREGDVAAAKAMYVETCAWRKSFSIQSVMEAHGGGEAYDSAGSRLGCDPSSWAWARRTATAEAAFVQQHGFFGQLAARAPGDGAPIAVWRFGNVDTEGYFREGADNAILRGFAAHLEDMFQSGRAASARSGRVVRARLVVDVQGVGLSHLRHMGKLKEILGIGKRYFPEVTATVTIVRAPRSFTTLFNAAQRIMTPVQRKKICILGEDFDAGLRVHAGIDRGLLPAFLGGGGSDSEVPASLPVPQGAGAALR